MNDMKRILDKQEQERKRRGLWRFTFIVLIVFSVMTLVWLYGMWVTNSDGFDPSKLEQYSDSLQQNTAPTPKRLHPADGVWDPDNDTILELRDGQ